MEVTVLLNEVTELDQDSQKILQRLEYLNNPGKLFAK